MTFIFVGMVAVFDFVVIKMSSLCSRLEEKIYLKEFKKNID